MLPNIAAGLALFPAAGVVALTAIPGLGLTEGLVALMCLLGVGVWLAARARLLK